MEEQQIKDSLNFIDSVLHYKSETEYRSFQSTLDLVEGVAETIAQNKHFVPYHLNLIDELHINENGHSRILYKLLEYRNPDGDYIFLESLLKYIAKNCEAFKKICVTNPKITQEQCRIDLWVRDDDYAIIFENKVYNATDQEAQIARYIECTQGNGYSLDKIFVIYLPQSDDKDPIDDSWGEYKEVFAARYAKFSFRNGVLPWLKSDVLPSISDKDKFLKSAIEQYVDYLEGLFKQRESDKQLYIMVENYIKEQLGLNDDPFVNKQMLDRKIEELDTVRGHLVNMVNGCKEQMFEQWKQDLSRSFTTTQWFFNNLQLFTEIQISDKILRVGLYDEEPRIYCGLLDKDGLKDTSVLDLLIPIMENLNFDIKSDLAKYKQWYGWKYVDWDKAYAEFVSLIEKIEGIK